MAIDLTVESVLSSGVYGGKWNDSSGWIDAGSGTFSSGEANYSERFQPFVVLAKIDKIKNKDDNTREEKW